MIVVSMLNQKGGVGKTSTTFHLGGMLASMGQRVLIVDNDPQSSLTQGIFGQTETFRLDPSTTIAALYRGEDPVPDQVIRPTGFERLDIVPGSESATLANVPDVDAVDPTQAQCLRDFLGLVEDDYDMVIIDSPPNLHLCSFAALIASDYIVIPLQPEDYAAQGIDSVLRSVARVQAGPNPSLRLLGYLLTRVGKKALHRTYEERTRASYGTDVFAANVPDAVAYCESIAFRKPISSYKPKGQPAARIRELADEFLSRIQLHTNALTGATS